MPTVGKPPQTFLSLFKMPWDDDHVLLQALPGAAEISTDQIVLINRIVIWIKHVAPNIDRAAGIYLAQHSGAGPHVIGQQRAGIKVTFLTGCTPVEDADFIV